MPSEKPAALPHLDYSGRATSQDYTAKPGNGKRFNRFQRLDRLAHATKLSGDLRQADLESERLKVSLELAGYEAEAGITLAIRSTPGHPLKFESLDSPSLGWTLESVRHDEATDTMVATVFVKHGKLSILGSGVALQHFT